MLCIQKSSGPYFDIEAVLLGITYVHIGQCQSNTCIFGMSDNFPRPIFINHGLTFSSLQIYKLDQIRCELHPPDVLEWKFVNGIQHKKKGSMGNTLGWGWSKTVQQCPRYSIVTKLTWKLVCYMRLPSRYGVLQRLTSAWPIMNIICIIVFDNTVIH